MAYVTTNDGVRLAYQEAGQGKPLVMIPGWSQSAALFKHQLSLLQKPLKRLQIILAHFKRK